MTSSSIYIYARCCEKRSWRSPGGPLALSSSSSPIPTSSSHTKRSHRRDSASSSSSLPPGGVPLLACLVAPSILSNPRPRYRKCRLPPLPGQLGDAHPPPTHGPGHAPSFHAHPLYLQTRTHQACCRGSGPASPHTRRVEGPTPFFQHKLQRAPMPLLLLPRP